MNAHSGRLVVATVDGRFGVAAVVARQMAFMVNLPLTYVATLSSMRAFGPRAQGNYHRSQQSCVCMCSVRLLRPPRLPPPTPVPLLFIRKSGLIPRCLRRLKGIIA